MKVIAICAQKGGVGKTTIALNLGTLAEQRGYRTVLIDVDPQQTLASRVAVDRGPGSVPDILSAQPVMIRKHIDEARAAGADVVIIDTAPNSEIASKLAMESADFILIPCRPAYFDLHAISSTVDLARAKPKAIVISAAPPPRSTITQETASAIRESGHDVADVVIYHRQVYVYATGAGQGVCEFDAKSIAAAEMSQLWGWLCGRLGIKPDKPDRPKAIKSSRPRDRQAA